MVKSHLHQKSLTYMLVYGLYIFCCFHLSSTQMQKILSKHIFYKERLLRIFVFLLDMVNLNSTKLFSVVSKKKTVLPNILLLLIIQWKQSHLATRLSM